MEQYSKPYNILILRGYADYFQDELGWPRARVEDLFERAGIDYNSLGSEDNWFSQEMANRFYNEAVKETGREDLAFEVGKFSMKPKNLGTIAMVVTSFFSPAVTLKRISILSKLFSKAAITECIESGRLYSVIVSRTKEGFKEEAYQCRNRMGMFKYLPLMFGAEGAIEHPECQFRGDPQCKYIITWEYKFSRSKYRMLFFLGMVPLVAIFGYFHFDGQMRMASLVIGISAVVSLLTVFWSRLYLFPKDSTKALESSLSTIIKKHDESELIRSLSNRFSQIGDLETLYEQTAGLVKRMMGYDRVMLLSVEQHRQALKVRSVVGMREDLLDQLKSVEFNIRESNKDGFLVSVVNSRTPLVVRDAQKNMNKLSKRSQRILAAIGSNSFIAVPILFSNECLGVLVADNEKRESDHELTDNDLRLLESVANSLGITINNVKLLDSLNKELKRTKVLKAQEEMMKEWFKKFVSTDVVKNKSFLNQTLNSLEIRNLSVMFIDIVGFSNIAEQSTTEDLAEMLNSYIKLVNTVVEENGGSVNKIIGDGILAYFENADQCVEAGLEILSGLTVLNMDLEESIARSIELGIGAHYGTCLKGNIGCEERLDHTVIGDTINTAARLESKTREFDERSLIVSRELLDQCKKRYCVENLGHQKLKGKEIEVEVFAVLDEQPEELPKVA